jgi:hypothetical protein
MILAVILDMPPEGAAMSRGWNKEQSVRPAAFLAVLVL